MVYSQAKYEGRLKLHTHVFPTKMGKIFIALDGEDYDYNKNSHSFEIKSGENIQYEFNIERGLDSIQNVWVQFYSDDEDKESFIKVWKFLIRDSNNHELAKYFCPPEGQDIIKHTQVVTFKQCQEN